MSWDHNFSIPLLSWLRFFETSWLCWLYFQLLNTHLLALVHFPGSSCPVDSINSKIHDSGRNISILVYISITSRVTLLTPPVKYRKIFHNHVLSLGTVLNVIQKLHRHSSPYRIIHTFKLQVAWGNIHLDWGNFCCKNGSFARNLFNKQSSPSINTLQVFCTMFQDWLIKLKVIWRICRVFILYLLDIWSCEGWNDIAYLGNFRGDENQKQQGQQG